MSSGHKNYEMLGSISVYPRVSVRPPAAGGRARVVCARAARSTRQLHTSIRHDSTTRVSRIPNSPTADVTRYNFQQYGMKSLLPLKDH